MNPIAINKKYPLAKVFDRKRDIAKKLATVKETVLEKILPKELSAEKSHQVTRKANIFAGLPQDEISHIANLMTEVKVPKGKVLVKQGSFRPEFILIVSGKASIKRDRRKITEVGVGDFLGELSMITRMPRWATVTALSDMVIKVLNPLEFMTMIDDNPKIAKKVLTEAVYRLQKSMALSEFS